MSSTSHIIPPRKSDGFIIEELDGEIVLLHPARNVVIYSNKTAALVWQMCDGVNTVDQIIEILSEIYPEARAQIRLDVPETIQKFCEQGVLDSY